MILCSPYVCLCTKRDFSLVDVILNDTTRPPVVAMQINECVENEFRNTIFEMKWYVNGTLDSVLRSKSLAHNRVCLVCLACLFDPPFASVLSRNPICLLDYAL
jgi:hypothetical protein